jgi:hypothetical protein
MSFVVYRPAGGISLNAGIREYLVDDNLQEMEFATEAEAQIYIEEHATEQEREMITIEEKCHQS